jgi:hypothetical protein
MSMRRRVGTLIVILAVGMTGDLFACGDKFLVSGRGTGHRATKVQTLDQLSTVMSSGRFDVILTANSDSANVQRMLATSPDAAIVVGVDDLVKNRSLMQAIDKAVLQRDQNLKKIAARSS